MRLRYFLSLVALILGFHSIGVQASAVGIYESFAGKYTVISRVCQPSDSHCNDLNEIEIRRSTDIERPDWRSSDWESREFSIDLSSNHFTYYGIQPLREYNRVDKYGNRSYAKVEGAPSFLAAYSIYTEWGSDLGTSFESRAIMKYGDVIQYSYRYLLFGNADGHRSSIERHYTLSKQKDE